MTNNQKEQITVMRRQGSGYVKIARQLGISENTVKSFCRRNGIVAKENRNSGDASVCEYCGKEIAQVKGRKHKRFCSDTCRNKWWNSHPELVKRKSIYKLQCLTCGKTFETYGNSQRKYCSHDCYVKHRFGGGIDE